MQEMEIKLADLKYELSQVYNYASSNVKRIDVILHRVMLLNISQITFDFDVSNHVAQI